MTTPIEFEFHGIKALLPPGAERFVKSLLHDGPCFVFGRIPLRAFKNWSPVTQEGFARTMRDLWMEIRHNGMAAAIKATEDDKAFDIGATDYGIADGQFDIWTSIIQAAKGATDANDKD